MNNDVTGDLRSHIEVILDLYLKNINPIEGMLKGAKNQKSKVI